MDHITQTSKLAQRYEHWRANDLTDPYIVEFEVIARIICGLKSYQQLGLDHTCANMFTDKTLKAIYEFVIAFVEKYGIDRLHPQDLVIEFEANKPAYAPFIECLNDIANEYTHSADISNWLIRLHNRYKIRLSHECCKTPEDWESVGKEVKKYLLQAIDGDLTDLPVEYMLNYETDAQKMIKTFLPSLDYLLGGIQGGNLILMPADTGMGKTAVAINIVVRMAKHGISSLFFSLEMSRIEILNRIIAAETGIVASHIRNHTMTDDELNRYAAYVDSEVFKTLLKHIEIPKCENMNISRIEAIVRKSKAQVIWIDYLGLVDNDKTRAKNTTYDDVSAVSRRLKLLALEVNKPIIALAQLNREASKREDKRPKLADIRDSGKLVQDSDTVIFVYKPSYYDLDADKSALYLVFGKSRHTGAVSEQGENGVRLNFNGTLQRLTDPNDGQIEVKQRCLKL